MRGWQRCGAIGTVLAMTVGLTVGWTTIASAASKTPAVATPSVLSGTTSTSWQTDNTVWSMAYAHGAIYAAGDFTSIRPSGTAVGDPSTESRQYMAAFDATTGAPLGFSHTFDVRPSVVIASPDGNTVYVGGGFTTIDGQPAGHLAAFSTADGSRLSWPVSANGAVTAMAISADGSSIYFGGSFGTVTGTNGTSTRTKFAALTSAGSVLPWAPTADNVPNTMLVGPNGQVYVGGTFSNINGSPNSWSAAAVDPTDGSVDTRFAAGPHTLMPPLQFNSSNVMTVGSAPKDIVTDGTTVYFANEGTGNHVFDGTFAVNANDSLKWSNGCLGATQAIAVVGGYLYKGSHAHDCQSTNPNGDPSNFPQSPARHLLAENLSNGYLGSWYPDTDGNSLGPRAMATDGTRLWVGGDFTTVNSRPQQGLAMFAPGDTVPFNPNVDAVSVVPGTTRVFVQAPLDLDDTNFTIRLYRDRSTTALATWTVTSLFWKRPVLTYTDTGLVVGSRHTYLAVATETRNSANSSHSSSASTPVAKYMGAYTAKIRADKPSLFWQLGYPVGSLVAGDLTDTGTGGFYATPATLANSTLVPGDFAASFAGTEDSFGNGQRVATSIAVPAPSTYSLELWFATTTTTGGQLIGFGDTTAGTSNTDHDRTIYMTNAGTLAFGTRAGSVGTVIQSSRAYNDGLPHHVVATFSTSGMMLYVDGGLVASSAVHAYQAYSGYWRVGGDTLSTWSSRPTNDYFTGDIGDVAVYPTALTAAQVLAHHTGASDLLTPPQARVNWGSPTTSRAPGRW